MWPRSHNYGRKEWLSGRPAFGVVGRHGGRSATVGTLSRPRADISESRQITYLALEMLIFTPKKNHAIVGRLTTPTCLGPLWTVFFKISPNRFYEYEKVRRSVDKPLYLMSTRTDFLESHEISYFEWSY